MDNERPRATAPVATVPVAAEVTSAETSPWALAGLGMQFFVALIAFAYAGNWIDHRFGTSPIFLLGGVFLGGGGTFILSYRRLTAPSKPKHGATDRSPRS